MGSAAFSPSAVISTIQQFNDSTAFGTVDNVGGTIKAGTGNSGLGTGHLTSRTPKTVSLVCFSFFSACIGVHRRLTDVLGNLASLRDKKCCKPICLICSATSVISARYGFHGLSRRSLRLCVRRTAVFNPTSNIASNALPLPSSPPSARSGR